MAESGASESAYSRGADRVRDAAKWLLAAFGAIATVLVAGSQLSSIGELDDGKRLTVAILGVVLALVGLGVASWLVLDIMMPSFASLSDVVRIDDKRESKQKLARRYPELLHGYDSLAKLKKDYQRALKDRREKAFGNYKMPPTVSDDEVKAAGNRVVVIGQAVEAVENITAFQSLEDKLRRPARRVWLFALAAVVALGIGLFAWAAHPPETQAEPQQAPVSLSGLHLVHSSLVGAQLPGVNLQRTWLIAADLRGANLEAANLTGARLRDADLRGVDLTGANLTDANLRGARLQRALVTGAVWANTTCPDGTKSDMDADKTCTKHESIRGKS
jgi:Pentapeptide repeats (8 copies)